MRCPSNKQIRQNAKEWMADKAEEYEEAKAEAFRDELADFIIEYISYKERKCMGIEVNPYDFHDITEDDLQGFLDSWTFPNEADWCADEYQNELETIGDIKYQEMKDER